MKNRNLKASEMLIIAVVSGVLWQIIGPETTLGALFFIVALIFFFFSIAAFFRKPKS